jgi:hypothetical protein
VPFGVVPALTPSQVDRLIFAECPLGGTRVSVRGDDRDDPATKTPKLLARQPKVKFPTTLQLLGCSRAVNQTNLAASAGV